MRADMVPGAKFPDYELTDHTRTRRRLSELLLSLAFWVPLGHRALYPSPYSSHVLFIRGMKAAAQVRFLARDHVSVDRHEGRTEQQNDPPGVHP